MKKLLSMVLALIMLISTLSIGVIAYADDGEVYVQNPFYTGIYSGEYSAYSDSNEVTQTSSTKSYNGVTYYGKGKQLYTALSKNYDARNTAFTIHYYSTTKLDSLNYYYYYSKIQALLEDFMTNGTDDSISTTTTDGDYSRWQIGGLGISTYTKDYSSASCYLYTIKLYVSYNTTDSEEASTDKAVDTFVKSVRAGSYSDYEIVKKIHDYICKSTTYDDDAVDNSTGHEYAYTAYGALVKGKCVCQGYALAFYRLCKELGLSVRFVSSDPNQGCHAWNIVKLDGKYYYVDCTWDDNMGESAKYNYNYYTYFLVDYDTLRSQDTNYKEHTLESDYDTDYFNNNYGNYISLSDYDANDDTLLSKCKIALSKTSNTYSGSSIKPTVTITSPAGNVLKSGTDYTATYSSNTNCGVGKININGGSTYTGMGSVRTFEILPAKVGTPSIVSGGRTNSTLTIQWSKSAGNADGYLVQISKDGVWSNLKVITSATTTALKITSLSPATKYQFRVKAYKNINRVKHYGEYSNVYTTCTLPNSVALSSVTTASKSITAKWNKVSCTAYQLQYSKNSNMSNAKTVKVASSATSKKISSLTKGSKYYVRIRAYKSYTSDSTGNTYYYYSSWSAKKSITVK